MLCTAFLLLRRDEFGTVLLFLIFYGDILHLGIQEDS